MCILHIAQVLHSILYCWCSYNNIWWCWNVAGITANAEPQVTIGDGDTNKINWSFISASFSKCIQLHQQLEGNPTQVTQTNEAEINCVLISNYVNKLKETMDAGNIGADNTNKLAMALHVVNKEGRREAWPLSFGFHETLNDFWPPSIWSPRTLDGFWPLVMNAIITTDLLLTLCSLSNIGHFFTIETSMNIWQIHGKPIFWEINYHLHKLVNPNYEKHSSYVESADFKGRF